VAAAITLLLDLGKGWLAVWLATRYGWSAYTPAVAGSLAIVGHCWPVWLRFRGGMGLATGGGAILPFAPLLIPLGLLMWWLWLRALRHSARAMAASVATLPLVATLLGYPAPTLALVLGGSLVIFLRHTSGFRRVYKRDWLA
jgi:glycerol-3-phosphate acyltransferase PlsY